MAPNFEIKRELEVDYKASIYIVVELDTTNYDITNTPPSSSSPSPSSSLITNKKDQGAIFWQWGLRKDFFDYLNVLCDELTGYTLGGPFLTKFQLRSKMEVLEYLWKITKNKDSLDKLEGKIPNNNDDDVAGKLFSKIKPALTSNQIAKVPCGYVTKSVRGPLGQSQSQTIASQFGKLDYVIAFITNAYDPGINPIVKRSLKLLKVRKVNQFANYKGNYCVYKQIFIEYVKINIGAQSDGCLVDKTKDIKKTGLTQSTYSYYKNNNGSMQTGQTGVTQFFPAVYYDNEFLSGTFGPADWKIKNERILVDGVITDDLLVYFYPDNSNNTNPQYLKFISPLFYSDPIDATKNKSVLRNAIAKLSKKNRYIVHYLLTTADQNPCVTTRIKDNKGTIHTLFVSKDKIPAFVFICLNRVGTNKSNLVRDGLNETYKDSNHPTGNVSPDKVDETIKNYIAQLKIQCPSNFTITNLSGGKKLSKSKTKTKTEKKSKTIKKTKSKKGKRN